MHKGRARPPPWVDDRVDYDDLRDVCAWVKNSRPTNEELDEYQHKLLDEVAKTKEEYCSPRWVEGYCKTEAPATRRAQCILKTGQRCERGVVMPGSENDDTSDWAERFEEAPVQVEVAPLAVCLPPTLTARLLRQRRHRAGDCFL